MEYTYDFVRASHLLGNEGHYWLDDERLSQAFCMRLSPRMADLLDLVMAVYAADRRSPRDFKGESTGQRRIHVRLALREPALWADPEIRGRLEELLSWLSEDRWSFEFVERQALPWPSESRDFLFGLPPERPAIVALFSGGLDSLAGLATHAQEEPDRGFVLVSGYTNNRLVHQQREQVAGIKRAWQGISDSRRKAREIRHLAVPFGIWKPERRREERSQRTRALVFLVLGVVAAAQAGADTLWVYENGVGALNLPLNATQLGVDNYRGVHPRSLAMAGQLFALVLGRTIEVRNRFLFHTKAEMCAALEPAGIAHLVPQTVSCDGFAQRVANRPQCGHCTSCVLRRQSLFASGLGRYDPPAGYRCDVLSRQTVLTPRQTYGLLAMRDQVAKLARCLSSDGPWRALVVAFPQLAGVHAVLAGDGTLSPAEIRDRLTRMYRAYVQEWAGFPATARPAA